MSRVPARIRTCSREGCSSQFVDRGPGSGLKRSLCSVQCERLEADQKASKADGLRRVRQQRTRGLTGSEDVASWPVTVFELYGDQCLSCGRPAQEAHHLVGRSQIMAAPHLSPEMRQALEFDPTNGFPICSREHELHTNGVQRIYWDMIPAPAVDWAIANGFATRIFDDRIYLGAPALPEQEAA